MCRKLMLYSHKILPMEKSNFFIVLHFFGEITVQRTMQSNGIKTLLICLVFREHCSHFDNCKWAHAYIKWQQASLSMPWSSSQPYESADSCSTTIVYVCVSVYNCYKFKSGIPLGLRYLRDTLLLTMCRKLIRLCKCLLNTLHNTQSYPCILPISVDTSICSFICILFGYLFNVLHCFIYAKTHELQPDFMFLRQHLHSKGCEWQKCDYRL